MACARATATLEAVRGIDLEVARRRGLRLPRSQRRRQDDDGRDPRGLPRAQRRRGQRPRRGPAARRARLARADRDRPAELPPRPLPDRRASRSRSSPATTGAPRPVDEVIALVGLDEQGRRAHRQALRRPAAAARRRPRPGRRPRPALPRRADDRLRPLRPPPGLGGDRRPARARQDRLPHHPLHGRGAAPRRPRRDHRRRRDRRPGHARGPRRPREPAGDDQLPARRRGASRSRRPTPVEDAATS